MTVLLLTQARRERDNAGRAWLDDHGLDDLVRPLVGDGVYHLSMKQVFEGADFTALYGDGSHVYPSGHERIAAAVEKLGQEGLVAAGK